jgi:hypothetical protein
MWDGLGSMGHGAGLGGWTIMVLIGLVLVAVLVVVVLWRFSDQPDAAFDAVAQTDSRGCTRTSSSVATPTVRLTARTACNGSPTCRTPEQHGLPRTAAAQRLVPGRLGVKECPV